MGRARGSANRIASASPLEPGGEEPPAVVVTEVGPIVLQRPIPGGDVDAGGNLDVVLLAGEVALEIVKHLAALDGVGDPSLADQEVGHHGVVDVALVLLLARVVHAEDEAIGLQVGRLGAVRHGIELAEVARGDERSVLALVQFRVDPHVLEVLQDELGVIREDRGAVGREADAPGNPPGCPAAASSRRASAGSCLKYLAPSPSCAMGSDHSFSAAGTAGLKMPTPSWVASMMPWRSMASEIA